MNRDRLRKGSLTMGRSSLKMGTRIPPVASQHSAQACPSYLFLVGVTSADLFSCRTAGFPLGTAALLPMRGTISLGWAFMAGAQS